MREFFKKPIDKFKTMSKQKKILFAVISVLLISAIAVSITLAVILTADNTPAPVFDYTVFYYGIKAGDTVGIILGKDWMRSVKFKDFDVRYSDDGINVSDAMLLTARGEFTENVNTQIDFYYKNRLAASFKVTVFTDCVYVRTAADLKNVSNAQGKKFFVQTADIILTESIQINEFSGTYIGNYHTVKGLDITEKGGLFANISRSQIYCVALKAVCGTFNRTGQISVGALANTSYMTDFFDCSAEGDVEINTDAALAYIGGLVGNPKGIERTTDYSQEGLLSVIRNCTSRLNISVKGSGTLYVGGLSGYSDNTAFESSSNYGNITIENSNMSNSVNGLADMYVGGIAGRLYKRYDLSGYKVNFFDESKDLYNFGNITVYTEEEGMYATINAGGVFGAVYNHNLVRSRAACVIDITTEGAAMKVGGSVGWAVNELRSAYFDMRLDRTDTAADIKLVPNGHLYAGGIAGETSQAVVIGDYKLSGTLEAAESVTGRIREIGELTGFKN